MTVLEATKEKDHDVVLDSAGWGEHARLTCRSCGNATYVAQPYMTKDQARAGMAAFFRVHPCETVTACG